MNQPAARTVIPGIQIDASGQATVDAAMGKRLIELAIELEAYSVHPVDVQHVLAAIILAADHGQLDCTAPLPMADRRLCEILARHVDALFERLGGRVTRED